MLVKDCMTRHPIMVSPEIPAAEAQKIMGENHIRHLPVIGSGKRLKGLVTRQSFALETDVLASLDIWNITRYLSGLKVNDVMIKAENVYTIELDRTIERAARTMSEHKIGCLPVIEDDIVVGIITEIDILNAVQNMLGLPIAGVRVTVRMPNRPGEFAKLSAVLGENGMGVMGIATYPSPHHEGYYDVVLKICQVTRAQVQTVLSDIPGQEIVDIREVV